jgi:hypothetical protein
MLSGKLGKGGGTMFGFLKRSAAKEHTAQSIQIARIEGVQSAHHAVLCLLIARYLEPEQTLKFVDALKGVLGSPKKSERELNKKETQAFANAQSGAFMAIIEIAEGGTPLGRALEEKRRENSN